MDFYVRLFIGGVRHAQEFRLAGGPIDEMDVYPLTAIGHAAMAWARLEKHIDILLIQINKVQHSPQPLDLYDENHPRPVTDKLKLLKRYFNRHPALAPYAETVRALATEIKSASRERNGYLHAVLERYDNEEKIATFRTIESKHKDTFEVTETQVPMERIIDFTRRAIGLNIKLAAVSEEIFTAQMLARLGKL